MEDKFEKKDLEDLKLFCKKHNLKITIRQNDVVIKGEVGEDIFVLYNTKYMNSHILETLLSRMSRRKRVENLFGYKKLLAGEEITEYERAALFLGFFTMSWCLFTEENLQIRNKVTLLIKEHNKLP